VATRRLVITGEEILDSGVQVIAQPPGKKNQTIHLLSGGEKALTAIALVFAIFQLNPAPFCLLDEVDAPLDDANTERYAKLVTSMSRETQFLFISHNKIAMEMAATTHRRHDAGARRVAHRCRRYGVG
jgi:chromosome segregation protein